MKNKLLNFANFIILFYLILMILLILLNPELSKNLSQNSARIWWNNIVPSLLPFMIITNCMVNTNAAEKITYILSIIMRPVFKLSNSCIYIIFVGLLCGFPMGSITIQNSLRAGKISKVEAQYLLYFTNNISPAFFITYIVEKCPYRDLPNLLFIQYIIPIIIGLFLRYTVFKKILDIKYSEAINNNRFPATYIKKNSFFAIFPNAIKESITNIGLLLGTIIIFSLVQLPIYNFNFKLTMEGKTLLIGLLEISAAIEQAANTPSLYPIIYTLILPFNGLSCMLQAYCILADEQIPFYPYIIGKIIHLFIAFLFFF